MATASFGFWVPEILGFFHAVDFDTELRAYRAVAAVPALSSRICPFYGVYEGVGELFDTYSSPAYYSRALRLHILPGATLWDAFDPLPSANERGRLQLYLRETLRLLHYEARVCHRDIKEDNIFICGNDAWLLDFGKAEIRADDETNQQWQLRTREDDDCLDSIFAEASSSEAANELEALLDGFDANDASQQATLTSLTARLRPCHADKSLLDRLCVIVPAPSPELACHIARLLSARHSYTKALSILDAAISRQMAAAAGNKASQEVLLDMLTQAATCACWAELGRTGPCTPSASSLYQKAIALAARLNATKLMRLRLDFAKHLQYRGEHGKMLHLLEHYILPDAGQRPGEDDDGKMAKEIWRVVNTTAIRLGEREHALRGQAEKILKML
ncbi:Serine threonine protein [Lasiodiplodia theobromae]|uniref:Serine threonine protein n=1 Tax=Lasiodiplodia theobromae TaxID=45133 RepID=UPI0015C2D9AE|nr:Serine threonine protein [Lasiodiplodia theobromae]KAF4537862.1 Serine threonine protein [Lasiodiplodia theobromae]